MTSTIPLGELVTIRGGGTPSRTVPEYWNGNIRWATVKDFKSTELAETQESITPAGVRDSATNIIPAGSVIIPTRMAVGKAAISTIDMAINQDLKALLPTGEVDSRFLLHFMLSHGDYLESQAQGATVKGIKLDLLRSLPFPRFTRTEQRRIAAILDKADAIRRKREQALTLADDFVRSLFEGMFFSCDAKWPTAKFSEVAELINGDRSSNYPSGSDIVSDGVLFVSTKNIVDSKLSLNTRAFITPQKFRSLTRGKLRKNDLIVTLRGSVGQAAIFDCGYETGFINAQIMIVRPSAVLHSSYLHQLFTHPKFQQQLLAGQSGSAVPQLTAGQIGRMEIPVPPISVQERFEHACKEAEKLLKKLKSDFGDSTVLFASLSQRAFRGEL